MDPNTLSMVVYVGMAAAGYVVAWLQHRKPAVVPSVPALPGIVPDPNALTIGHGLILSLVGKALAGLPALAAPGTPAAPPAAPTPDLAQLLALAMALLQAKPAAPAPPIVPTIPNVPTP